MADDEAERFVDDVAYAIRRRLDPHETAVWVDYQKRRDAAIRAAARKKAIRECIELCIDNVPPEWSNAVEPPGKVWAKASYACATKLRSLLSEDK